ncbi:MAG: phage baseplate upper protein [Alkalibacterium sp.]|nr:phage baseplate upper protein [Alkalibacterium sp.]
MPIRKKGDVEIKTSASGAKVKQTGYTFYSYDKNAAALYFQFRGQDGQPTDLGKATVHLVMILNDDNGKKFIPGDDEIEVLSAIRGKAKFVLPEMLLAYQGKVTGYVYMNFDDGSRSDDGQFTFRIKHSMITHVLPELGDKYVRDFEDVKEQVEQAADGAKETISQKVTSISDLEKNLDVEQKNYFSVTAWENNASTDVVDNDLPTVKLKLEGNTQYTLSTNIPIYDESFGGNSVFFATSDVGRVSSNRNGVTIDKPRTITTKDDGGVVIVIRDKDMTSGDWWIMLNKGETSAGWVPNVDDLATKQYVEEFNETQLAQTEKLLGLKTYVKYGGVDLTKFEELNHDLNFNLWRDPTDGKIKHDWTLKKEGYTTFYISPNGRADTNDGKSIEEPWPELRYTLETIENDPSINKAIIKFIDRPHRGMNFYLPSYPPLTKKYIIESDFPLGAVQEIDAFTNHVDNVFKAETTYASYVEEVLRVDAKDYKGNFKKYERVSSLSECVSKKDTYFTDSSAVYVHGEGTNVENTVFLAQDTGMKFPVKDGGEVILNNINYLAVDNNLSFVGNSNTTGKVILNNVNVNCFNGDSGQNGIETNGIKSIWLFNCRVFGSRRDGFNYHNTKQLDGRGFVFEYDCYAENTGNNDDNTNNNISTAHEGIHVLRVGTKGNKSRGPLIADIQGCYSLNIDVFVNDTRRGNHLQNPNNAGFYFDDNVSEYVSNPNGKAWLINCGSGSPTEWGINGSDSFKQTNKIFIDNYMGINLPQDLELTLL